MTNGWIDIKNTDMMLIMGGNPAENHPCGFKWPVEAKLRRNAKMIVVDPRFTRTATQADLFLQIRAGTDIAFLGGLINYAIQTNRIAKDYLIHYTNAAFIVKEGFKLPEDGLFSGFDGTTYDKETWNYEAGGKIEPTIAATATECTTTATAAPPWATASPAWCTVRGRSCCRTRRARWWRPSASRSIRAGELNQSTCTRSLARACFRTHDSRFARSTR